MALSSSLRTIALSLLAAACARAETIKTGDVVDGYPVITKLDLADVPANAVTRYYFRAGQAQGTVYYDLPLLVARGSEDSLESGTRLSLSSSVHGDELTGVRVVQTVFAELERLVGEGSFNGTVIGIPTVNTNGIQHNQRNFYSSNENGFLTNLNRVFPGEAPEDGGSLPEQFAYNVWNGVWGNTSNTDVAIDLHTVSIPYDGPMWVYADYRLPGIQRLAELAQPDIIKIDPGEPGSVETSFVSQGVPAITLELGPPKSWLDEYTTRGRDFILRLLADRQMIADAASVTPDLGKTYVANERDNVPCQRAGFAVYLVKKLDDVAEGQEVAKVYNSFGDEIESVTSPVTGRVLQVRMDPAVEPGTTLVVMASNSTSS